MMQSKTRHFIGLDIGTSSIKAAQISSIEGQIFLDAAGMIPTPPGALVEGRILGVEALVKETCGLFNSLQIRNKNVAMAVGRSSIMLKEFPSFHASGPELHELIAAQAEEYFPYDISKLNFDYHIPELAASSEEEMKVLVAAVRKDWVQERVIFTDMAGLQLSVLDVEAFALQNVYQCKYTISKSIHENANVQEVVLLVDIGEEGSSLIFLSEDYPVMVRENNKIAVSHIINQIQSIMDISRQEAAYILVMKNLSNSNEKSKLSFLEIYKNHLNSWCIELQDQIRLFKDEFKKAVVSKICLSGGGALLDQFPFMLTSWLQVPVDIIYPFKEINTAHTRFFPSNKENTGSIFAIAIGLALRKPDER